jgi:crotonobetainyl-CoA:carnitine CoA-transferase CaiB-like acyl-CoA transferase
MSAATMVAFAITAAVLKARAGGVGDRIDLGMADVLANWVGTVPTAKERTGAGPVAGYGVYPTKDGQKITLGVVSEERLWASTCEALGLAEHAGVPFLERLKRVRELDAAVASAVGRLTRDEAMERLTAAGAPVAPLLSRDEMMGLDHFRMRGVVGGSPVRTVEHPPLGAGPVAELDEHRDQGWRPQRE